MGWVVKELRTDAFEALRLDAERDARRVRRTADRTARGVAADLAALEQLAAELQGAVRRQRMSGSAPAPRSEEAAVAATALAAAAPAAAAPAVAAPVAPAATAAPPADAAPRRRAGRASMRSSALADLFRATDARPRVPRMLLDVPRAS